MISQLRNDTAFRLWVMNGLTERTNQSNLWDELASLFNPDSVLSTFFLTRREYRPRSRFYLGFGSGPMQVVRVTGALRRMDDIVTDENGDSTYDSGKKFFN